MTSAKQEIFVAIKGGDAARVRALAAQDPSLAKARDESGVSALLQACYHSRLDMVEALLAVFREELELLAKIEDPGQN